MSHHIYLVLEWQIVDVRAINEELLHKSHNWTFTQINENAKNICENISYKISVVQRAAVSD